LGRPVSLDKIFQGQTQPNAGNDTIVEGSPGQAADGGQTDPKGVRDLRGEDTRGTCGSGNGGSGQCDGGSIAD